MLLEELLFAVHEGINIVRCQLEFVAMRDRIGGASFYAVATKNASRIIDVINVRVTLACGYAVRVRILRGFNVDAIRRARGCAKKTPHALFQAIFVSMQNMDSPIPGLEMHWLVRVVLRDGLAKYIAESNAEALHQRAGGSKHILDDGWHRWSV